MSDCSHMQHTVFLSAIQPGNSITADVLLNGRQVTLNTHLQNTFHAYYEVQLRPINKNV